MKPIIYKMYQIYVYYVTGKIYDRKAQFKYVDSNKEEASIQSSKYEN